MLLNYQEHKFYNLFLAKLQKSNYHQTKDQYNWGRDILFQLVYDLI
jgi:hypothetical protein